MGRALLVYIFCIVFTMLLLPEKVQHTAKPTRRYRRYRKNESNFNWLALSGAQQISFTAGDTVPHCFNHWQIFTGWSQHSLCWLDLLFASNYPFIKTINLNSSEVYIIYMKWKQASSTITQSLLNLVLVVDEESTFRDTYSIWNQFFFFFFFKDIHGSFSNK